MGDTSNIQALVEARHKTWNAEADRKVTEYKPFIDRINEHRKTKGEAPLDQMGARNVATCLDNSIMEATLGADSSRLFETVPGTAASNIAFLGVQLPIISAILPSLVLNEIATVQALDRRQGSVFYFDMNYGTNTKGQTSGNTLVSSLTGHARSQASRYYGSQMTVETCGTSGSSSVSYTVTNRSITANTVIVTDGTEIWRDNGSGSLISNFSGYSAGTVSYTNGTISLTWTYHTATNAPTVTYGYAYDNLTTPSTGSQVPSVQFNMTSKNIEALDFPLQATYTMAAALDLKKAHGMDLESEMVKLLGGEIKFELDHFGIDLMYQTATSVQSGVANVAYGSSAGQASNFDGTIQSGQEFVWRKYQFLNNVLQCSNLIQAKTLRGIGNFIVCDLNVARLIMQLKPDFEPIAGLNTALITGPTKIGTLMGRPVIQDPFLTTNTYFMGYKGDSFLMSSFIFAPYIPLFSTPTLVTSDLIAQKGFMSSAGYFIVNPGLFAYGTITNV